MPGQQTNAGKHFHRLLVHSVIAGNAVQGIEQFKRQRRMRTAGGRRFCQCLFLRQVHGMVLFQRHVIDHTGGGNQMRKSFFVALAQIFISLEIRRNQPDVKRLVSILSFSSASS